MVQMPSGPFFSGDVLYSSMRDGHTSSPQPSRTVTFQEPVKALRGMIDSFALLEGRDHDGQLHEVLPKSNFRLVFTINSTSGGLAFLGPNTKMRTYPLQDYFVVHFHPGLMPRMVDVKPTELTETFIPLKDVLGTSAAALIETIQTSNSLENRQRFMEDFFRKSGLDNVFHYGPHLVAVRLIRTCEGRITVNALASGLRTTVRTLERIFMEHVGLPPKKFIRLIRFQHALQTIRRNGSSTGMADLAYACGFTDQSHLIKEFRSFAHRPPGRF